MESQPDSMLSLFIENYHQHDKMHHHHQNNQIHRRPSESYPARQQSDSGSYNESSPKSILSAGIPRPNDTAAPRAVEGSSGTPMTLEAAFPWLLSQLDGSPTTLPVNLDQPSIPPSSHQPLSTTSNFDDDVSLLFSDHPQESLPRDIQHHQPDDVILPSNSLPDRSPKFEDFFDSSAVAGPSSIGLSSSASVPSSVPPEIGIGDTNIKNTGVVPMSPPISGGPLGWTMWDLQTGQIPIDQVAPNLDFPHNYISNDHSLSRLLGRSGAAAGSTSGARRESSDASSMTWPLSQYPTTDPDLQGSRGIFNLQNMMLSGQQGMAGSSTGRNGSIEHQRRASEDGRAKKRGRSRLRGETDSGVAETGGSSLTGRNAQSVGVVGVEGSPKRRGKARAEPREIMEVRSRRCVAFSVRERMRTC